MREVVYKNLTLPGSRKKDIFVQEVFEKDGITAKTERRCFYFIKEITRLEKPEDLQGWMSKQSEAGAINRRQFYIFKRHNDASGEERLICKILGNFCAVVNDFVYTIAFLHSFKVRFSKGAVSK